MKTNSSFVVTVSVNGVSNKTLWHDEKPFEVGFPVRWVMERSSKGVLVRHFGDEASAIRELDSGSLSKGAEVDLPFGSREKSGFKVILRPVETLPPAYDTLEAETSSLGELRVYACRGDWTPESVAFDHKYVGSLQHRDVFTLTRQGGSCTLKSLDDELELDGEGLGRGQTVSLTLQQISGRVISVGEFKWRVELQKRSADPAILLAGQSAPDAETLTFRKALKGAGIGILALGVLAIFWPKVQIEEPKPEVVTQLKLKKPIRIASAPNGSHTLSNQRAGGRGAMKVTAAPAAPTRGKSHAQAAAPKAAKPKAQPKKVAQAAPAAKAKAKAKAKPAVMAAAKPAPAKKRAAPAHKSPLVSKAPPHPKATVAHSEHPTPKLITPKGNVPVVGGGSRARGAKPSRLASLFSGLSGASKGASGGGLLAGSRGGYGNSRAEAHSLLTSGEGALGGGVGGAAGSLGTGAVNVGTMGGGSGGSSGGIGYGRGSRGRVNGQGKSLVSLDTGSSDVEEGLTREQVGRVIHAHMSEIRYCYESAKLRSPDLEGKTSVAFVVGAPGSVKQAGVASSSVPDSSLNDCVIRRLVTWKFPQPKGGVNVAVNYPFIFKTLGR